MKFGVRTPSLKRSFKARTTGRIKRGMKRAYIPGYGKKGAGLIKNPKKAIYNKIYNKTTVSMSDLIKHSSPKNVSHDSSFSKDAYYAETIYYNKTILWSAIFGGWFGLHKYMRKQIGMGIVYTFTAGLFFIGWISDIVIEATRPRQDSH